ncbi:L,D-transpeptidase family protein [Yoonia vestfoldensis]|uniref:L,D-transpeptidase family protein n=1 Tax=Yoonia vestfoldensis TaxID=245188 RepID=UPI0003803A60|nr:L,D-transpeptidase family protein [Yoonia vestfoldensis]
MMIGAAAGAAGCSSSTAPEVPTYFGPDVTRIQVFKEQRTMQLLHNNSLLRQYRIDLGFDPKDHKQQEGDGRTPEGAYLIDRQNPNSRFHLSIGISYPNADDVARARAMGVKPGGDIFIHGTPTQWVGVPDWTWGCIAVTNTEMEEVYSMVRVGTKIFIYA